MPTDTLESALDEAQVLVNSANAVRVFEALTDGPTTNRDLAERTGAARSTVGRILDRGESRGWIDSEGSQYEITDLGETMIEEFGGYLRTLEGIQHLGKDFQYLPEPAHELDYHHFRDATIIKPTAENPSAPFDRQEELIRAGDKFPRAISHTVLPQHQNVALDLGMEGKQENEMVLGASFLETLRKDPERAKPWYDWAEREIFWIHEDPPITMLYSDEVVMFELGEEREDEVYLAGLLESENPAVLSWAESLFEDYRAEAEPLTPEMLPER